MTPPLGLRHMRDDLECSRGTTEGPERHAQAPTGARSAAQGGTPPGPPPPSLGENHWRGTLQGGKARVSAASEDHSSPEAVRQWAGD